MASLTCNFSSATTAVRSGSYGFSESWGTVANCLASDNNRAQYSNGSVTPYPDGYSFFLVARDLVSAVPVGATITGFSVQIERRAATSIGTWRDSVVTLWVGSASGSNKAVTGTAYTSSDVTATYGGSGDTWGLALTAANLNASSFGVAISVAAASLDMEDGLPEIDFIGNATVYYTEEEPEGESGTTMERVRVQVA